MAKGKYAKRALNKILNNKPVNKKAVKMVEDLTPQSGQWAVHTPESMGHTHRNNRATASAATESAGPSQEWASAWSPEPGKHRRDSSPKNYQEPSAAKATSGTVGRSVYDSKAMQGSMNFLGLSPEGRAMGSGIDGDWKDQISAAGKFMISGSNMDIAKKMGVAVGAYAGLNYAGRAITGGGVTYNSSGQRDIMGLPF